MTEAINSDYEGSSEGAVRHWEVPYARLEDTTPTETNPAAVLAVASHADQLCGTILTIDADDSVAVIDFTSSMVYRQQIRNVLTYNGGVEATWGAINIGDFLYYDRSGTMPAGVYLSTSPADNAAGANPFFGHVVSLHDTDMALYPKGGATASTQTCGACQRGAGT